MNTPNDELFRLIKSLSKNEKGYFKKFASRHVINGANVYVKLFDAIDKQKKYDENKIKLFFNGENFVRFFSSEKKYLFNFILKSLSSYNSRLSTETILREDLRSIEILYNKGLYDICNKKIKQAKKIAIHYQKSLLLLEIQEWEEKIMIENDVTKLQKYIEGGFKETIVTLKRYNDLFEFRKIRLSLIAHISSSGLTDLRDVKSFKNIKDETFLNKMSSYEARDLYYGIIVLNYWFIKKQLSKAYEFAKKRVLLAEELPHMIGENAQSYLSALNATVQIAILIKEFDEAFQGLVKYNRFLFDKSNQISDKMRTHKYVGSITLELSLYINSGKFKEGLQFINKNEKLIMAELIKLGSSNDYNIIINFCIAYLFFLNKEHKKALHRLNNITNNLPPEMREDFQIAARLLVMIIYMEIENIDMVEYGYNNLLHYLKDRKGYHLEKQIISYLVKFLYLSKKERKVQTEALKNNIAQYKEHHNHIIFLETFDIISWLESKLNI